MSSRRTFVKTTAAALAGVAIVPRHVVAGSGRVPPSDRVTLGFVGVGSQGLRVMIDFLRFPEVQAVAVCDVNRGSGTFVEWGEHELRNKVRALLGDESWGEGRPGAWAGREPAQDVVTRYYAAERDAPGYRGCTAYLDYRDLLERERDLDGIVVGTPDHLHAAVSVAAMRAGKHVFCQKPMAHTVHEARVMAAVAAETGVATQVATGNAASEATRVLSEWIWAGAIGPVRAVHNWSSRPFWPQGLERPAEAQPVPEYLDWDRWLGPAPYRPYHEIYQPFNWRGWVDFGASAIGDMGCYSFDTLFRVLRLQAPERVEASSSKRFAETYPAASLLHFHFPARGDEPPVTVHWYDGGLKPVRPEGLGDEELPAEGMLFVGDRGQLLCDFTGGNPRLLPASAMAAFEPPPKTLPRSIGHYEEWLAACRGEGEPAANFGFAGLVTEAILLGNVALRSGETLTWDPVRHEVRTPREANDLLHFTYREGWEI